MAIDFSKVNLQVIDINLNATPDLFVNQGAVTFTKRVLEDLNYPQNVQFSINKQERVFAIRPCKSSESKATSFSKSKSEQVKTLSFANKNLREILVNMIPEFNPKKRYKVTGFFDIENRIMYYDMNEAQIVVFREKNKSDQ